MKKTVMKTLLSSLLVALVLVGGTLAYLTASDSPLINTFKLAKVSTEIHEETGVDKAPQVKNTGESPVYVRAKAVITDLPEGVTVDMNSAYNTDKWEDGNDGFYYYREILQPSTDSNPSMTAPLFTIATDESGNSNVKVETDMAVFDISKPATFSIEVYQEAVLAPANAQYKLSDAQAAFNKKS